jgi:hypothetical protein
VGGFTLVAFDPMLDCWRGCQPDDSSELIMPRHDPVLHRSRKVPMTLRRRRLLIIGAMLLLAALGWARTRVLEPVIQRSIVIATGRTAVSIMGLPIAMPPS